MFVNRVGTEAGVRFWGGSRVIDPSGEIIAQAPFWEPALITGHLSMAENAWLLPVARAGGVRRLLITHPGHTVSVTTG